MLQSEIGSGAGNPGPKSDESEQKPSDLGQDTVKWVIQYLEDKFAPTPLVPATNPKTGTNGKAPRNQDWATRKVTDVGEWGVASGIGLTLGSMGYARPKLSLLCVDLDSREAVRYGSYFLPDTKMVGGRHSKPKSNHFYVVEGDAPSSTKFQSATNDMHVEILGPAHQVVVAPTVVIDKEERAENKVWHEYEGGPTKVEFKELEGKVLKLAVFCELARIWPTKGRHDLALPLAGGLLRAGWSEDEVIWSIQTLGNDTGWSQTPKEVENLVRGTATKLEIGETRVSGWPTIIKVLGSGGDDDKITKSIAKILGWLKADVDDRPGVEVRAGQFDKIVTKAWRILADANNPVQFMRFSNAPVRIERMDDRDQWGIVPMNSDMLRFHASGAMTWFKKGSDGERRALDPPKDVIAGMLASGDIPLPVLSRLVTAPVFAPDGVLQTSEGYHPSSRTWLSGSRGLVIPEVSVEPREGDLTEAKRILLGEVLVDFPFAKKSDKAHALALMLLPFARDMIEGPTPMHIIDANTQASGKTLLASVTTMPFVGEQGATPTPFPTSEEEMNKTLLALLSEGRTHVNFDNVTCKMASASLAMAITGTTYTGRRLGVTETLSPPVRCIWMATANQATGDTDVIRRSVHIRLVSKVEHPHLIPVDTWKHFPLRDWVVRNRGDIVWACLTLISHWVARGMVRREVAFGDFGDWSGVMGGILEGAGISGFLDDITDFQLAANEDREAWQTFFDDIWHRYGEKPWAAGDTLQIGHGAGLEIRGRDTDDQKRELGSMLRGKVEVIHGGLRLQSLGRAARRGAGRGYFLEPVDGRTWTPPNVLDMERDVPKDGIIRIRGLN